MLSIHSFRALDLLYAASYTSFKKKKGSIPPDCFAKEHGKLQGDGMKGVPSGMHITSLTQRSQ